MGIRAGKSEVIAEWNGSDTSQFGGDLFSPDAGTIGLSVVAQAERNYLELNMSGFRGRSIFPMSVPGLGSRYIVRWHMADQTGGFTSSDQPRLVLFSNLSGVTYRGIEMQRPHGTNNAILTQEQGASQVATASGTLAGGVISGNNRKGSVDEYEVIAETPVSTDPDFLLFGRSRSVSGIGGEAWDDALLGPYSGWGSLAPAGTGIGVRYGNTQTGTILIGELAVLRHPLDR